MKNQSQAMTERQIGFAMMDIALTAQSMERVVMMLQGGDLEDDRDREAMFDVLISLTQKVGCLSDSVSELIGATMLLGPREWHLNALPYPQGPSSLVEASVAAPAPAVRVNGSDAAAVSL